MISASQFEVWNAARLRRDPTYDGIFFIAVRTTGIYCRPVCPGRQPLTRNIEFHPTAASAEASGYRPCLRCRPESAPFCPAWNGTRTTVERALRLIDDGALDGAGVSELSRRLGIGPRHLRRLFQEQVGASPLQVARTRRIQRAKLLLHDPELTVVQIAELAGFPSVRRLNADFRALYDRPPSSFRPKKGEAT